MEPDEPTRLEQIFDQAVEFPGQLDRARFLDQACGEDVDLRQQLERLLAAHDSGGNFLKLPDRDLTTKHSAELQERPGTIIDRYKLLEQIGEGGFGVVFMAEQERPVRRKVAIKVIKLGMDTKQVVARFEAERQALALMDHPNIAKVFDAGATATGRPYFVMELVKGVRITDYCNEQKLNFEDRLKLFTVVCGAIQHAHQKGIIHRDIKPSNILVTMHDDKPVPMVIDFGIAKATSGPLTDRTLFTEFRQMLGTPAYMSPEQAQMSAIDVDTRSDIYSLGVLLYELLTGTTPFDPKELFAAGQAEIQRIIREVEPPKPSTRLSTLAAGMIGEIACDRQVDPARLCKSLAGDLDLIAMKCGSPPEWLIWDCSPQGVGVSVEL